jgi:hypothetical protein
MRSTLAGHEKSACLKTATDFAGLENRDRTHNSSNRDVLSAHKLSLNPRTTIFENHLDYLSKVRLQLLHRFSLRVSARKARNITDQKSRLSIPLDYCSVVFHRPTLVHRAKRRKFCLARAIVAASFFEAHRITITQRFALRLPITDPIQNITGFVQVKPSQSFPRPPSTSRTQASHDISGGITQNGAISKS